jgi:hypothetical protein
MEGFVSVAEFLENGGKLDLGREIYQAKVYIKPLRQYHTPIGKCLYESGGKVYLYNCVQKGHGNAQVYVKIEYKPLYV